MAENVGTYQGMSGADSFERARQAFASLGAKELSDVQAAADYAQTTAYAADIPFRRADDAALKPLATEAEAVAARVLEIRPGHLVALRAHSAALGYLSTPANNELHFGAAVAFVERATVDEAVLVRLDPTNADDRESLEFHTRVIGMELAGMGRTRAALPKLREAIDVLHGDKTPGPNNLNNELVDRLSLARLEADLGDAAATRAALGDAQSVLERIHREREAGSQLTVRADALFALRQADLATLAGDPKAARTLAIGAAERLSHVVVTSDQLMMSAADLKVHAALLRADAAYSVGDYAEALDSARAGADLTRTPPRMRVADKLTAAQPVILEAMALARLGRTVEAAKVLAPVLAMEREYYARNHDFEFQRLEYATALFAEALAEPSMRATSLAEANRVLHALPAEMQTLASVRRWQQRVTSELAARP
jgi:tetratricopeptide (TPR) repeat protein